MEVVLLAGSVVVIGLVVHRLALAADRRGWLYYRTKSRFKGSSLGLIEEIYHPATHHVIDEQQSERGSAEQDASGDPPDPGERR